VLLQSGYVTEAVVIAKQDIENNRLISYYTPDIKVVKLKKASFTRIRSIVGKTYMKSNIRSMIRSLRMRSLILEFGKTVLQA
jgi:hypothetical protein